MTTEILEDNDDRFLTSFGPDYRVEIDSAEIAYLVYRENGNLTIGIAGGQGIELGGVLMKDFENIKSIWMETKRKVSRK